MFENIARDLLNFQKPARYIGSELGIPQKDYENSFVRFACAFPIYMKSECLIWE
ncbi:MAG TPA: hypothetical protein PLO95_02485 [Spirochaetota bacterium]|nr:hypothetical protein [Spirochaetota bacterium]